MPRIACRVTLVLATILTLALDWSANASFITYDLKDYPALQNGYSLSGTITTDGTIGDIGASNIVSWSVTLTPSSGGPITFSSTGTNPWSRRWGTSTLTPTGSPSVRWTPSLSSGDNQLSLINQPYLQITYARQANSGAPFNTYLTQVDQLNLVLKQANPTGCLLGFLARNGDNGIPGRHRPRSV